MFDKFKSLFSKENVEIRIDDIPSVVTGMSEKDSRLESQRSAILFELKSLETLLKDLSDKSTQDNYVNVLKDRFCDKGIKSLASIPDSYDPFVEKVSLVTQEVSGIGIKEFRHFQVFKEDMSKIANQIKVINGKLEDFKKSYYSSSEKRVNDILSLSSSVKRTEAEIAALDNELREVEKAIPFIKDALERDERKLSEVMKKLESLELEVRGTVSEMETEKSIIKQKISTEFGKLDNVFKKMEHEDPKKYRILARYIANSGDAFMADDGLEIRSALEELKPLVRKEEPEKYEKVLELLRNIDFFDSLRQQYRGLASKIRDIRDSAMQESLPLEKERNHLILAIEDGKNEISQLLEKRAQKTRDKERLIQQLAESKADLQIKVQELMQREVRLV